MSVPRFYLPAELAAGQVVALPASVAHHATKVLRLREDAPLTLFNGRGGEFAARLLGASPPAARVEAFDPVDRESPLAVTLVQALVAADKVEWIIEKCTEAGVARLLVAPAERSTVKLAADRRGSRVARWGEIAIAACCQCGRNRPPVVSFEPDLRAALAVAAGNSKRWILAPGAPSGIALERATEAVSVAIGPEGDWSPAELAGAESLGYKRAAFGPRVLRTETAGVAVIVALQAAAGDLGVHLT